jgi:hypothetical protein
MSYGSYHFLQNYTAVCTYVSHVGSPGEVFGPERVHFSLLSACYVLFIYHYLLTLLAGHRRKGYTKTQNQLSDFKFQYNVGLGR